MMNHTQFIQRLRKSVANTLKPFGITSFFTNCCGRLLSSIRSTASARDNTTRHVGSCHSRFGFPSVRSRFSDGIWCGSFNLTCRLRISRPYYRQRRTLCHALCTSSPFVIISNCNSSRWRKISISGRVQTRTEIKAIISVKIICKIEWKSRRQLTFMLTCTSK